MADERKNPEFLGGGPKFNTVGKDVRGKDEVIVPKRQTGYWLRIVLVGLVVVALAGVLFYLENHAPGRSTVPSGRGRPINSGEHSNLPTDPNLR